MPLTDDIQAYTRQLLASPEMKPSLDEVMDVLEKHPGYAFIAAVFLARCPEAATDPDTLALLQAKVMLACPDAVAMSDFANLSSMNWANFYPPVKDPREKTTTETIDSFLETYCSDTASQEDALLERLIFNPVASDYLQAPEDNDALDLPPARPQDEAALQEEEPQLPANVASEPQASETRDEPLLMESLAKIYIKQRRYERAFEIITNLSLKNTEKSIYFADQLRFLQKLIIIQRSKQNSHLPTTNQ